MSLVNFSALDYSEILDKCFEIYQRDFGANKFSKVFQKVVTSDKLNGMIGEAQGRMVPPGTEDILARLNTIPYFMFSRNETQAIAALLVLQRWHEMVNVHQNLLNEEGLKLRAMGILKKLGLMF